jgi:hypothetical protein
MTDQGDETQRRLEPSIAPRAARPQVARPVPGAQQSRPVPRAVATCPCDAGESYGALWWARIPGRTWAVAMALTAPVRALALVMDMMVSAAVLGALGAAAAWWTGRIPDETVARVLGEIGKRGLAVVVKSGVLGG